MADVVVVRGEDGKLAGLGERGQRAWARFRAAVEKLEIGETLVFSWWAPRSPKFHRWFFAMLQRLLDMQEQFDDVEDLRAWLTVGAGACHFLPGPRGRMVAMPKSIKWHRMDDTEFAELVRDIQAFLRTEHARRFLWGHLDDARSAEMVDLLFAEFEA